MELSKDTKEKLQELQILEQNLQALLLQKQAFQAELNETDNALSEVFKTKDDIYKIVGQIMLKSKRQDVEKELKDKKGLLSLRLKSIEKQEAPFKERLEKLRAEVTKEIKKS